MKKQERKEFTNLVFADWMLPGEWQTREVQLKGNLQTTAYTLATKTHINAKPYVDFWGREDPYGPGCRLIFVCIHEFKKEAEQKNRFSVTTGRGTDTGMSTNKFFKLEDAIEFAVNEMIKTTKYYDKVNKRKTPKWDYQTIIARDPKFQFEN